MRLYHITQTKVDGYDTYSDAVVAAHDDHDARLIHPAGAKWEKAPDYIDSEYCWMDYGFATWGDWADNPEDVTATLIGIAQPGIEAGTVICASYHAG